MQGFHNLPVPATFTWLNSEIMSAEIFGRDKKEICRNYRIRFNAKSMVLYTLLFIRHHDMI